MKDKFRQIIEKIEQKYNRLIKSPTFVCSSVPASYEKMPGVYLLSERNKPLYVGRSNNVRRRLKYHTRGSHYLATFAFLLAREETGGHRASYKPKGSRDDLLKNNPSFKSAFDKTRARIGSMDVRVIEEKDPVQQALLEIYVAFVSRAKYNNFDTH